MSIIAIDIRMIRASGIGLYLRNIIPFIKQNYDLILFGNREEIEKNNWGNDIRIIELKSPIYSIQEQIELYLKNSKNSLFWSPHYNAPILPIRSEKRLITIHDVFHLAFFNKLSIKQKIYAKIVMKAATTLSDKIITVSEFSRSELIKYTGVSDEKIEVIYNGIDTEKFHVIQNNRQLKKIRKKYNLPDKFLLFVGNVKPHKNLIMLLNAFYILRKQDYLKEYYLVIVGKKEGFITGDTDLFKVIQKLFLEPYVKFTDFVADNELPSIYNLASVFVFPSLYEGFGFPPLEAMACGCPVIVSNVASLPEVCGDAALYCDPNDVNDIAEKIRILISNPPLKEELRRIGIEHVSKFPWRKCAEKTCNAIENLLNG